MNPPVHQTILALQQLKIKDRILEKELSSIPVENYCRETVEQIYQAVNGNSAPAAGTHPSDAVNRAWQMADEIIAASNQNNVRIFSRFDPEFPDLLRTIPNPPVLLHVKGNFRILNSKCVAVIGTREPCEYSRIQAGEISSGLVREGFTIVSGLARGVDAAAHEGALNANGKTIAILAHGLHMVYPAENRDLAAKIVQKDGALISEYSWYTPLVRWFLVDRDRLQSGMSSGVFVIETKIKGGTMHTIDFCKKQHRQLIVLNPPKDAITGDNFSGNLNLIGDDGNHNKIIVYDSLPDITSISDQVRKGREKPLAPKGILEYAHESPAPIENVNISSHEPSLNYDPALQKIPDEQIKLPSSEQPAVDVKPKKARQPRKRKSPRKPKVEKETSVGQQTLN
jgi:DNA processing protein